MTGHQTSALPQGSITRLQKIWSLMGEFGKSQGSSRTQHSNWLSHRQSGGCTSLFKCAKNLKHWKTAKHAKITLPMSCIYPLTPRYRFVTLGWSQTVKNAFVFVWMAEELFFFFFLRYKASPVYSCNIYEWKHNRGRDLQRCQHLSCLLHTLVYTHIKTYLDSSIIKPQVPF